MIVVAVGTVVCRIEMDCPLGRFPGTQLCGRDLGRQAASSRLRALDMQDAAASVGDLDRFLHCSLAHDDIAKVELLA
jgi:hypothetical protein